MRNNIKIQRKCIQTRLTNEGQLIDYTLTYPVSREFKWHLQIEEPDENDFVKEPKNNRFFYTRSSTDFKKVKQWMLLIMIKSSDFKIKQLQQKKDSLVTSFSNI